MPTSITCLSLIMLALMSCQSPYSQPLPPLKGKGGLLTTHFQTLEDLGKVAQITYAPDRESWVRIRHESNGQVVENTLAKGINETDLINTRDKGFLTKAKLGLRSPYFVMNRQALLRSYLLSRRRDRYFGGGDVTFFYLAEAMSNHIHQEDLVDIPPDDLSDKGYINTFNHMTAQAFITAIFSEEVADFIADIHERNIPELITGKFTEKQLSDPKNGAVDNYIDMINNEWGQEIGKRLKQKYHISTETIWTPNLMAKFLNDLQRYYGWSFEIGLDPFRPSDIMVIRYATKINKVMGRVQGLR
ncbi:MAG: hypothetical protein AAFR59_04070 [Bacteroidota bacterium]